MGTPLEGAFLIWDEILKGFSLRLSGFTRVLATSLLESITKRAASEPRTDVEKEAHTMWLLHILGSDHVSCEAREIIDVEIMKLCCLHPGYWTQRIGREVLQLGGSDLRADWQDLFNASSIGAADLDDSQVVEVNESALADWRGSEQQLMDQDLSRVEGLEDNGSRRWKRAVTSLPLPLGVVQLDSKRYMY